MSRPGSADVLYLNVTTLDKPQFHHENSTDFGYVGKVKGNVQVKYLEICQVSGKLQVISSIS